MVGLVIPDYFYFSAFTHTLLHMHFYERFLNSRQLLKIIMMLMIMHLFHAYSMPYPVLSALILSINLISAVL